MERELTEEELENFVGGVPREFGEEMAKKALEKIDDGAMLESQEKSELDELFEDDLEKVKAGQHIDNEGHIYR